MEIKTSGKKFSSMAYKDPDYQNLVQHIQDIKAYHLSVFIGHYIPDKKKALKEIAKAAGHEISTFDFNDIVSKLESETFEAVDRLIDQIKGQDHILYFSNGDKLCGAYTGFTHSKVKYATPQERYFLKKIQDYQGLIIIEISEYDNADETILRAAHSIVRFPLPKSPFRRIIWNLKNLSLNGYDIKTKRPEGYIESPNL